MTNKASTLRFGDREPRSPREAILQELYFGAIRLFGNPLALIGIVIIAALCLTATFAPLIATHDPIVQDLNRALKPPSWSNFLGTDELGRDIYSRIVYGSRITLYIVILVSVTVGPIGLIIGATAGYVGGVWDTILMRITDLFLSFPGLVLTLAFAAALGPGLGNAVLAIALTSWPPIARLARAEALTIAKSDFIAAAQLQGASAFRIITRHIMPLCMSSLIVRLTLNMAGVILTAAGLGFLGLGAQPPTPEWGAMTSTGRRFMLDNWWLVTMPGMAILIVSLAFNLFGDGLRDVLDPRQD
jgi:peptide/nickel transport system permease protein